ncbi:Fanconi anemia group M protein-like isoform X3 [Ctenopharyngodon idella]|uniref:Fanconi anemia group M protein-like isoform X3 n=1 Tax=Ctenopharyngodon idella TaxID=7959 RepID=UPI00222FFC7D|nr:Fanconi anemia group M protein-like isoform X3 [Ctenopharyngodon idella]
MSSNQRTLFQSWGCSVPHRDQSKTTSDRRKTTSNRSKTTSDQRKRTKPTVSASEQPDSRSLWGETTAAPQHDEADDEDDDDVMLVAVFEAERSLQAGPEPGFDPSAGRVWIYPTNYPVRQYQLQICEAALLRNTLVCLPTGLGKTFIAAVLMYNYYRWFPAGKIVFMAPTKPLVAQQIQACYGVMGIPQQHMAELTGSTAAQQRRELWRSRRVFFLTPQVMVNDLSRNTCPAAQVKCVVIDEAHKATGNHAYCQVVRELRNQTQHFRVLALSATPGGDVKAVQQVISNLLISHIELRSEDSPDVQTHVHQRSLEKIVVPLGESLTRYQTQYLQVLEKFTSRLTQMRLLNHRDLRSLTKYQIILAREQFRRNPPPHVQGPQQGPIEGDFALCISLYHGYELLQQMGVRSLFLFIQNIFSGPKESSRMKNELQRCPVFMDLYREMETMFATSSRGPQEPYVYSHPKLQKLDEVVLRHFQTWAESSESKASTEVSTRVMIFSSFRESVQEIAEMLNRHQPLVRVMTFMGQASAGKGVRGFTQKEQLEVVRRFREGGFNTLVSTCVGEEGLDIGEVDLIVCFDAQKSPIRLVQRMGRTGRRRQGRIVVILAEGREERTYNQSQSNRRSINKSIMGNKHSFQMFPHSPRMLPAGVTPTLHKMHISCGQFEHRDAGRRSTKGRRSSLNLQMMGGEQTCVKDDGFLSAAEEAVWTSTMRLSEDEAQPVFRPSSLLTFSDQPSEQEPCVSGPVRELSLWEWRHWQNRPLHTHSVGHSERCLHFTSIMELIDRLRQEEQGDCSFESELMLHLQKEDVDDSRTTKPNTDKIPRKKRPKSNTAPRSDRCWDEAPEDQRRENDTTSVTLIQSTENRLDEDERVDSVLFTDDGVHPESDLPSQQECLECLLDPCVQQDESSDLQHMFYQSEQNVSPKRCRHNLTTRAFQMILANVKELLSRSPPQGFDFSLPDLSVPPDEPFSEAFQVTFSLAPVNGEREECDALSPGWDELFDDDDKDFTKAEEQQEEQVSLDESVDLFGDDEAFLQLSVPDVRTPDKSTGPDGKQQTPVDVSGNRSNSAGSDQAFNCSQDFFSVNFDLGFESEEEECVNTGAGNITVSALKASPAVSSTRPHPVEGNGRSDRSPLVSDQWSPVPRPSASTPNHVFLPPAGRRAEDQTRPSARRSFQKTLSQRSKMFQQRLSCAGVLSSDSEGETPLRTPAHKVNPVFSPESKICSDVESPVQARRKRMAALNTSEESDADFQDVTLHQPRDVKPRHVRKPQKVVRRQGCQFLDEEAELSEDEDVSSDEEDGDEQNHSLQGFVVNATQCSQGLNDSEMQAVYLKSVRSPAVQNRVRMTYKLKHNMDIFSQVPEQDETYAEDSFVVDGSEDEEESDDDEEPVELIAEDSYVDGRKQYATRRRVRIRATNPTGRVHPERNKRTRIIRIQDSSEEEEECDGRDSVFKVPQCLQSVPRRPERDDMKRQRLSDEAALSEELDFHPEKPVAVSIRSPSAADAPLRVLVDGRCISGGSEVVSCLRLRHGVQVHVCSLVSADFIVSNRMAVEWQSESEVASVQNRKRLQERIQRLQASYERVCLIIQSDRTKPGEAVRAFQRSRYYDGTLAALVKAGVRLLVSKGPEETAALLSELTQVERRKGQAIDVPLEVKGHRQQALQFCLTLPHVSYISALNMCHHYSSVGHMISSSVEELQASARVSRSRAEDIYRCLRYSCC